MSEKGDVIACCSAVIFICFFISVFVGIVNAFDVVSDLRTDRIT